MNYEIREAKKSEFIPIGKLMVKVYSKLKDFPSRSEQPHYYEMLEHIGEWCQKPCTYLLVAVSSNGTIGGAVVYFSDMQYYGSGGIATQQKNAAGFRLLAVDPDLRGQGLGKKLTVACIEKARKDGVGQVIIHSTKFMEIAWKMYEKMDFQHSSELDFMQEELPVFGFRLKL